MMISLLPVRRRAVVLLHVLVALLIICARTTSILAIETPVKAGEYSKEFFDAHRKNAAVYDILVNLFLTLMANDEASAALSDVSVLDIGCGHGLLVEAWRNAGVTKSYCIEGSPEASHMWPLQHRDEFYVVHDLEAPEARVAVKATDFVTSFEVAEHIRPEKADHFVGLLTMHHPKLVFLGAATPFQDRGMNPSHVNENTFQYWIDQFASHGYHVDWATTARAKHMLISNPETQNAVMESWWYPKNLLIFAPKEARERNDGALLAHPKQADMLNPAYLNIGAQSAIGKMWKDDWQSFGTLFYEAQTNLLQSLNVEF